MSVATPGISSEDSSAGIPDTMFVVVVALSLAVIMSWNGVRDIWATGNFYDTDDAMRMVQTRDWLAGQSWYDLTAWRFDPPRGVFMHWSRVVDLPIGALLRLFSLFTSPEKAELLTRIAWPLMLQAALLAAVVWVAREAIGERGVWPAALLLVLSGFELAQFRPGRVDHEGAQIVLLMTMIGALAASFDAARARHAATAAFCIALSLAISVENLPFILLALAVPPVAWIVVGAPARAMLLWFAGGLLVFVPAIFAIFSAPSRWLDPACDAFSVAHVSAALGGALVCGAMALATPVGRTPLARLGVGAALAAIVGAPLALAFSGCAFDPYGRVDPLVRELWLKHVSEIEPGVSVFLGKPGDFEMLGVPALIGVAGAAAAAWFERGVGRARFALILAMSLMGCAATALMIRSLMALLPVAGLGAAWLATRVSAVLARRGFAVVATLLATAPMSVLGWSFAPSALGQNIDKKDASAVCRAAAAYPSLARLPAGLALADIDVGAYLLAHTPHSVLTAPYHRGNHGNRLAMDILLVPPDEARLRLAASGARYLFQCGDDWADYAKRAPGSLAAHLVDGEAPDWLTPVALVDTPFKAFEIAR